MQPAHVPECVLRAGALLQRHMLLPAGLLGRSLRQEVLPSRLQRPGFVRQRRVRVPTWAASTRLRDGFVSTWLLTERLLPEWHGKPSHPLLIVCAPSRILQDELQPPPRTHPRNLCSPLPRSCVHLGSASAVRASRAPTARSEHALEAARTAATHADTACRARATASPAGVVAPVR